jgi:predicted NAD-dependent protein-ADP-ribosyltransferase YbiA (DUF1768 family)
MKTFPDFTEEIVDKPQITSGDNLQVATTYSQQSSNDAPEPDFNSMDEEFIIAKKLEQKKAKSASIINIYAGTRENAELSNFAERPFTYKGINYNTVEGAFQAAKLDYAQKSQSFNDEKVSTEDYKKGFSNLSGNLAKQQGRSIKGLNKEAWDANSSRIMKERILESFKQNPNALAKLLATGNATLTHTQDKTKWGKEFPRLLMEVRDELRTTQPSTLPKTLTLKNGVSYSTTNIDIPLLESLGYSPEEMNEVFNNC